MLRLGTELRRDIAAARERDPAARQVGRLAILAAWPGVHALLAHRLAHSLLRAGVSVLPRAIAYVSRAVTGIEIHPAARIAELERQLAEARGEPPPGELVPMRRRTGPDPTGG
jgi:serine O-acetyltransferase